MKLCRWLILIIAASVFAACATADPIGDTDASSVSGSGGASTSVSTTATSTSSGAGGSGGEAPAGVETVRTYRACDEPSAVRPGLSESGAIALGRFVPSRPSVCRSFRYEIIEGEAALGSCRRMPHHVVAFVGSASAPDEATVPASVEVAPEAAGEQVITLDPPLVVGDGQAAYVGVEMLATSEEEWSCVATCMDFTMRDANFWSVAPWSEPPPAPWGWTPLYLSPSPALGYHGDLRFELDCEPR